MSDAVFGYCTITLESQPTYFRDVETKGYPISTKKILQRYGK